MITCDFSTDYRGIMSLVSRIGANTSKKDINTSTRRLAFLKLYNYVTTNTSQIVSLTEKGKMLLENHQSSHRTPSKKELILLKAIKKQDDVASQIVIDYLCPSYGNAWHSALGGYRCNGHAEPATLKDPYDNIMTFADNLETYAKIVTEAASKMRVTATETQVVMSDYRTCSLCKGKKGEGVTGRSWDDCYRCDGLGLVLATKDKPLMAKNSKRNCGLCSHNRMKDFNRKRRVGKPILFPSCTAPISRKLRALLPSALFSRYRVVAPWEGKYCPVFKRKRRKE